MPAGCALCKPSSCDFPDSDLGGNNVRATEDRRVNIVGVKEKVGSSHQEMDLVPKRSQLILRRI